MTDVVALVEPPSLYTGSQVFREKVSEAGLIVFIIGLECKRELLVVPNLISGRKFEPRSSKFGDRRLFSLMLFTQRSISTTECQMLPGALKKCRHWDESCPSLWQACILLRNHLSVWKLQKWDNSCTEYGSQSFNMYVRSTECTGRVKTCGVLTSFPSLKNK